jgi:rRNA maturation endonuclease Nob1
MIVLRKGAYHYHAMCHTCHTEAIMNLPINHICPNCGDLMVVFELQKPLKMAFVEAYDYKSNQEGGKE